MLQNCTILCPTDEPQRIVAFLRGMIQDGAEMHVMGRESNWSKIDIKTSTASLTLNRQVHVKPGDSFSKMLLGMRNYFSQVTTSAEAIKKDVLDRVVNVALAIGVVAEPVFLEEARHYDCIFGIAAALNAIIWTGRGVIDPEGKLLLDSEGVSEVS